MTTSLSCPICSAEITHAIYEDEHVIAVWDAAPVSPGHALIAPQRHISSWFSLSPAEQQALLQAIVYIRKAIDRKFDPAGFNIGFDEGFAAGQRFDHIHLQVIPRYSGDMENSAEGIRHIVDQNLPEVSQDKLLICGDTDPFLPYLLHHIDRADTIDIAVAFTMSSGIQQVYDYLHDLLKRGGRLRFLSGDYLGVTDPDALLVLLDLQDVHKAKVDLRIYQTQGHSFHPKAYIFHDREGNDSAIVGSSNLSAMALQQGLEWNYRVISSRDKRGYREITQAYDDLFQHPLTLPLTAAWVNSYRLRRTKQPTSQIPEVTPEQPLAPPVPHSVQEEALRALQDTRQAGNQAGLVVLATGLGKTWLSAFDSASADYQRILFVAHREEILHQAMRTYRRIRPQAHLGLYTGQQRDEQADILFASIQTLGKRVHMDAFRGRRV